MKQNRVTECYVPGMTSAILEILVSVIMAYDWHDVHTVFAAAMGCLLGACCWVRVGCVLGDSNFLLPPVAVGKRDNLWGRRRDAYLAVFTRPKPSSPCSSCIEWLCSHVERGKSGRQKWLFRVSLCLSGQR